MSNTRMMESMTVREVRDSLRETQTVLVPVGSTEQHGYHLPLSTDTLDVYLLAQRVSEETGCFVTPPVAFSFSGGELPGTVNIAPETMALLACDIFRSLATQGFRRIVFLLGHGATENTAAIKGSLTTLLRLEKAWKDVRVEALGVWELSPTWWKAFQEHDYHAAIIETSLVMHFRPDLVRKEMVRDYKELADRMQRDPDAYLTEVSPKKGKFDVPHMAQDPTMQVGVMGDPAGANADLGGKVAEEVVAELVRHLAT